MSGFLSIIRDDRIEILSDASHYGDDGGITAFKSKALPLPGMRAVLTGRGKWGMTRLAAEAAAGGSFDEFVADLPTTLERAESSLAEATGRPVDAYELVIGGWSDKADAPKAFLIVGHANLSGLVPRQPYRLRPGLIFQPEITPFAKYTVPAVEDFDVEADGIALFEAMRRQPYVGISGSIIGGFLECSQITRAGVSQRVIHTWPADCEGEEITP